MSDRKVKHLWMVEDRVSEGGDRRSYWTKIGLAFENVDGSFSLHLSAIPVNGRLQMRDPFQPKEDAQRFDAAKGMPAPLLDAAREHELRLRAPSAGAVLDEGAIAVEAARDGRGGTKSVEVAV